MNNGNEARFAAMVDEVQRKRIALAGADNYAEGYWHGIAVGMLAMLRLIEKSAKQPKTRGSQETK